MFFSCLFKSSVIENDLLQTNMQLHVKKVLVMPDVYYYMTFEDVHIFKSATASIGGIKLHSDVHNFMNLEDKIPYELFTTDIRHLIIVYYLKCGFKSIPA